MTPTTSDRYVRNGRIHNLLFVVNGDDRCACIRDLPRSRASNTALGDPTNENYPSFEVDRYTHLFFPAEYGGSIEARFCAWKNAPPGLGLQIDKAAAYS
jgi:hypothetical protein